MLTKDKELIDHLPETSSIGGSVERVVLLQKIGSAQREIENDEGVDWEDIKKEMDLWLK